MYHMLDLSTSLRLRLSGKTHHPPFPLMQTQRRVKLKSFLCQSSDAEKETTKSTLEEMGKLKNQEIKDRTGLLYLHLC